MRHIFFFIIILFFFLFFVQEGDKKEKIDFSVVADVVSAYVWRGLQLSNATFQPMMTLSAGNFFAGAGGSVNFQGTYKDAVLLAGYSFGNLTFNLIDYWIPLDEYYEVVSGSLFDFSETSPHLLEAGLAYTFNAFPLTLGWNTIIAGGDKYEDTKDTTSVPKLKQAYSSYIEASYAFSIKETELNVSIGVVPWKSSDLAYATAMRHEAPSGKVREKDFAIINISLTASKELKITDSFSLPVYAQMVINPTSEDAFFVFGIKF
jgi:hypothetical protein